MRWLRRRPLVRVLAAMQPDPWRGFLAVVLGTAAVAAALALLAVSGWLISRAAQQPPVMYLMVAIVAVRALGIGRGVLRYAERLVSHDVALRGVVQLRASLYDSLSSARPGSDVYAASVGLRGGDLLARLGADVDTVADVVTRAVLPAFVALTAATASVIALTMILPAAGATLAVGLLIGGVVAPALTALAARRAEDELARDRGELGGQVQALMDGWAELSVAGISFDRRLMLRELDRDRGGTLDSAVRPAAIASAAGTLASGTTVLGCLLLAAQAVSDGRLAPVMLAVVTLLALAAAEVTLGLPAVATTWVRARAAADRLAPLLPPADATGTAASGEAVSGRRGTRDRVQVQVHGMACGWPGRPPILQDVSLDLRPGARVGLVGPSGSGKSTLLLTLAGLIEPVGSDLRLPARESVLYVSEDAHVFSTSLRENLRLAAPTAPDGDLISALQEVELGSWFASLPQGLDTLIGSTGQPLSGGETRRLLLARAVLSPARIILLDEPAEHLDPSTADHLVRSALSPGGLLGDRTVVVATHRLRPLAEAGLVLVVGEGRIRLCGTHRSLQADPAYRAACEAETSGRRPVVKVRSTELASSAAGMPVA